MVVTALETGTLPLLHERCCDANVRSQGRGDSSLDAQRDQERVEQGLLTRPANGRDACDQQATERPCNRGAGPFLILCMREARPLVGKRIDRASTRI